MKRRLALHLLASLLAAVPAAADIRFHSATAYGNRLSDSDAAVIGDFNGDGRNDIALVRGSSLLVMFGTAAGQLIEGPTASVSGGEWVHLVSGDFNGDAKLDLAIANLTESGHIAIMMGAGDGTFTPAPDVPAGRYPVSVAVADLNGDGIVDVAAANIGSGDVSVLFGQGNGSCGARVDYAVGLEPRTIVASDLNGDGAPDLAVAHRRAVGVSILLNDGDGIFATAPAIPLDSDAVVLAAADFNGDARQDLAISDVRGSLLIALGLGDGTFGAPRTEGATGGGFVVADFTHDGVLDVAAVNPIAQQLRILRGVGDGRFLLHAAHGVQSSPRFLVAGHLDSDSHLDLAIPRQSAVAVARGLGDGTFLAARWTSAGVRLIGPPRLGDFNNDGIADLVVGGSSAIAVHLGTGGGNFAAPATYDGGANEPVLADFNRDGNLDVVTRRSIRLGIGDGTLGAAAPIVFPRDMMDVVAADFNMDGRQDLVASAYAATTFIAGNGDGTFQLPVAIAEGSRTILSADFNGDGKPDVAFSFPSNPIPTGVLVMLGNGDGTFFQRSFVPGGYYESITTGDFNNDGIPDLALSQVSQSESASPHRLVVVVGQGNGTFRLSFFVEQYDVFRNSVTSDFDGDGNADLVVMQDDGLVRIFAGDGQGRFVPGITYVGGDRAVAGDYDGDGKDDLVTTEINFGLMLHRNISP